MTRLFLTGIAALLLATGAAHAQIDLGQPIAQVSRTRIWSCGYPVIVVLEPNDPVWDRDKTKFTKGLLQMEILQGHLTYVHSEKIPIAACTRMPNLAGDPFSLIGLGAFGSQPLRLPLVL